MADAREVGQRFIDAFNAHDERRIRELHGENAVFEAPGDVRVEGATPRPSTRWRGRAPSQTHASPSTTS